MSSVFARDLLDQIERIDEKHARDGAAAIAELERFSVAYQASVDGLTQPRRRYGG